MTYLKTIFTAIRKSVKISKAIILLTATVILGLVCLGCGGGGGGSSSTGTASDTVNAGITGCHDCHADGAIAGFADENIFSTWLNSPHGNYEGTNYEGGPAYTDLTDSSCDTCHDEIGDGTLLAAYYLKTGITFLGTENRPVVGCESCHGSGSGHFGIGDIPYPAPGADICGKCHKQNDYHAAAYPEGDNIYADYQASPHANPLNAEIYAEGSATDVKAVCSKCHTDEGAKKYKDNSATYSAPDAALLADAAVADAGVVQCRTCHDAHSSSELLKPADTGLSSEYQTCTSCHQNIEDSYHGENNPEFDAANPTRTIYDTHFDDGSTVNIEGYNIDPANTRACRDCHNPHNADTTINNQWANSAHGGHILDSIAGGRANVTEKPWMEYDFKGADRQACQRCHTATGFRNYAAGPSDYDPANNSYSYLGAIQKEMLYCWACHTNTAGALNAPGAFVSPRYLAGSATVTNGSATVTGTGTTWNTTNIAVGGLFQVSGDSSINIVKTIDSTTQVTLNSVYTGASASNIDYHITPYIVPSGRSVGPGTSGSTICVSCHSGRQTGEFIKNYPVSLAGKNFGSFNSHYLAAGGIMYRTIGYEYAGQDYSDAVSYVHPTIGSTGGTEGDDGPCVGCHMKHDESHSFEVVEGALGAVTDINSYTNVCSGCHGNKASLISTLNTRDTQYNDALSELDAQLQGKGIYWCASYPYFKTAAACGGGFYTAWPDKDTLGAAFNYNLLKNIPAAYVHNREYTRKIIYDSIDFLDDGIINQSVEATLGGSGDAYDYLNGTR